MRPSAHLYFIFTEVLCTLKKKYAARPNELFLISCITRGEVVTCFCRIHLKPYMMFKPIDLKQHIRLGVLLQSCTGHPARIKIKSELPRGGNVVTNGVCITFQIHGEILLNSCNPHLCTAVYHAKIVGFSKLIRVSWGAYWFYNISVPLPRQKRAESFKRISN